MEVKKKINTRSDLALFGAQPSFQEILHVGRPNIGEIEIFKQFITDILDRRWLSNQGPLVEQLESQLCSLLGVKHCVAVCNGTIGLEIAIRALGLAGEVIVPSYTFIATAHALSWLGVKPVFVDIDVSSHNIAPQAVRAAITDKTTGILATHLWGRACDIEALQSIADAAGISLLFDAAHAFMCSNGSQMIGNFGNAEVFSFHATKFFNSFEGGAITTNDDQLAEKLRLMRNFGFSGFDNVVHVGTNGKMHEVSAAMGLANLLCVDGFIERNRTNYQLYREAIANVDGISIIDFDSRAKSNFQYIVIEVGPEFPVKRDTLLAALHAENILARKYFWPGCHRMPIYRDLACTSQPLSCTEAVSDRVIVLPTGSTLPPGAVEVVANVMKVLARQGREGCD